MGIGSFPQLAELVREQGPSDPRPGRPNQGIAEHIQADRFGRPRELPADSPADFGKHVAALGKLLAQAGDRNYAQARIAQYRQLAERRSGKSHLKSK